jgi:hypothetical protein
MKILIVLTILAFSVIVSQAFMYIIALKNVSNSLNASSYIEFRHLIDANFRANFKYAVYGALITNLLLVIFSAKSPNSLLFITATFSFVALIIDTILTLKGNMPLNDLINTWSVNNYPENWSEIRTKWLQILQYRQIATILGFISLIIGAVFGK